MRALALDTTTREGSVALVAHDAVIAERPTDPQRSHAEQLPAALAELLAACGTTFGDIDLFAVALGPGSFTGLRIGIATMQGLAFVCGRPLAGVSALEAIGQHRASNQEEGARVGVWMDAQRGQVFSALYEVGGGPPFAPAKLIEIQPPLAAMPAVTLERWAESAPPPRILFAGSGAVRYAGAIRDAAGDQVSIGPAPLLAGTIGRIALARPSAAGDPAAVRPLYVRRPDAELARDKKRLQAEP
jgi:tRNA threonylcarbamoyladenosine biosynthesis protein TsaB